ncbi:hypothetical protein G4D82_12350 [Flavobacterium sp. CYK-4]|uniref:hypothetical protein n=1 Tax=Flavobacterium lotistagni TaxID=2709660 RepID=UPI00140CF40F|nr:hypothetical protein [Flavobacterium lotistagni]NHM08017.1 hypothetical protein [Flavobacterium lotistagni]
MKNLSSILLIMTLCAIHWTAQCQTEHKDLNSRERVEALYKINEQRKAYREQIKDCQRKANEQIAFYQRAIDSISKEAIDLGLESKEYVSHNLDLQEGLLSSLKKQEKIEVELATLKAKRKKRFGLGCSFGWNLLQRSDAFAGPSFNYDMISF